MGEGEGGRVRGRLGVCERVRGGRILSFGGGQGSGRGDGHACFTSKVDLELRLFSCRTRRTRAATAARRASSACAASSSVLAPACSCVCAASAACAMDPLAVSVVAPSPPALGSEVGGGGGRYAWVLALPMGATPLDMPACSRDEKHAVEKSDDDEKSVEPRAPGPLAVACCWPLPLPPSAVLAEAANMAAANMAAAASAAKAPAGRTPGGRAPGR